MKVADGVIAVAEKEFGTVNPISPIIGYLGFAVMRASHAVQPYLGLERSYEAGSIAAPMPNHT